MTTRFDEAKTKEEVLLDKAIAALERTHPEQKIDAMADYLVALRYLEQIKSIETKPLVTSLKRLYIYPNRPEHNEFLIELHDFKEILHETRIHTILTTKESSKLAQKGAKQLGEGQGPKKWPWVLMALLVLIFLLKK
jgi:hypothetical protein